MSSSIFDWLHLAAQNVWLYGGGFLLVLGILVFVHEWGHYIVARMNGVKVESFSIGFGKELFGYTDKHGTRWKFSLVPLGGYVKMLGDTDPASAGHSDKVKDSEGHTVRALSADEKKVAFYTQPVSRRAAIVFAGPAINFIFAIVLLAGLFLAYGQPVTPPVAGAIVGGSAAEKAGFQPQDVVLAIDGKKVQRFEDIRRKVMIGLDTPLEFTIIRAGKEMSITATPQVKEERDHFGFKHNRGMLGLIGPGNAIVLDRIVSVDGRRVTSADQTRRLLNERMGRTFKIELGKADKKDVMIIRPLRAQNEGLRDPKNVDYSNLYVAGKADSDVLRHNPVSAVGAAVRETVNITTGTLEALGQMFTGTRSTSELGGVIRIGAMAGDMAKDGFVALVTFTALLSINLGLINLFPIPMLDGGHLAFYAVEAVRGHPIPERIQEYAFRFGLAILVGIMLFANLNDIIQLIN